MELYEYADPQLMAGKKILYVHGFASSGENGTVRTLRLLLPEAEIIAPDLHVEPSEAMELLRGICAGEAPDLIIGTSMGGMYAEQLRGFDRILVNPAFQLADTLLKNNGLGRQEYHSPRRDGETSFLVNKGLIESFRECSSHCFEDCDDRVWGLFGIHDTMVDTFGLFAQHYSRAIRFDGEHYMNDKTVLHSVIPLIRRIDDAQNGISRKTLFISLEDTLADFRNEIPKGKAMIDFEPEPSAAKAFAKLSESYEAYVVVSAPYNEPQSWPAMVQWCEKVLGVPAWDRIIFTNRRDLILGDYLIDRYTDRYGASGFMGTVIEFGSETFRTWEDILTFFGRLGGQ